MKFYGFVKTLSSPYSNSAYPAYLGIPRNELSFELNIGKLAQNSNNKVETVPLFE
jgi:hypothetical protein